MDVLKKTKEKLAEIFHEDEIHHCDTVSNYFITFLGIYIVLCNSILVLFVNYYIFNAQLNIIINDMCNLVA